MFDASCSNGTERMIEKVSFLSNIGRKVRILLQILITLRQICITRCAYNFHACFNCLTSMYLPRFQHLYVIFNILQCCIVQNGMHDTRTLIAKLMSIQYDTICMRTPIIFRYCWHLIFRCLALCYLMLSCWLLCSL